MAVSGSPLLTELYTSHMCLKCGNRILKQGLGSPYSQVVQEVQCMTGTGTSRGLCVHPYIRRFKCVTIYEQAQGLVGDSVYIPTVERFKKFK